MLMDWILLGLIAVVAVWAIAIYNGLVGLRARVKQAFADIDVQLKQRHDLIPNLIETVKGYAAHESQTLEAVVRARNVALSANSVGEQSRAETALSATLGRLLMLQEAYPNLKADGQFQNLQMELADMENKIAATRRFFNNSVSEYNTAQEAFPAVLIAHHLGFARAEWFDVGEEKRKTLDAAPQVKFS
jgi:LemA protein